MINKVRVSGILINPVGEPISGAVITFTSVTNSLSVLSGESASINTNTEGSYSTELSYGEYSITISRAGKNSLYGAITIADTTGPSTINELLKQQIMETEVTPDVILYFRQIQKQVASDLATMNVLNGEALDAATRAGEYRDEAGRYAADLSDAVATARRYRDEAGKSAAASLASEQKSKQSETNAQSSETNSAESERNALIYKNTAVAAAETAAEEASTLAAEKTEQKITAAVKQDADRAELARDESESIQADVTTKFNQVNANTTATLTARNEAVNAATSAGQSATTSTNNANATAHDRIATAADKQQVSADKATSQSAASTATTKAQLATTEANRATAEADRAVATLAGKQDKSALLTAISALSTAANQLIYLTGKDAAAVTALTDLGRRIIAATKPEYARAEIGAAADSEVLKKANNLSDLANAELARNNLELGSAAVKNAGSNYGDVLSVGDFGLGDLCKNPNVLNWDQVNKTGFYMGAHSGNSPSGGWVYVIHLEHGAAGFASQIALSLASRSNTMCQRTKVAGTWTSWVTMWTNYNTAVDSNGFIKKASPIVKLHGNGECELNYESVGVTTERLSEGVYRLSGSLMGFNADAAWDIEVPADDNKQPLIWVKSTVEANGDIIVKTYHRTHPNAPKFAQNVIDGYSDGDPIDIPSGRWVDLRVQVYTDELEAVALDS